jgi:hypothetical protein
MVSGLPHKSLPPLIEPVSEDFEGKIITALLAEINELYTMNLHTNPELAIKFSLLRYRRQGELAGPGKE